MSIVPFLSGDVVLNENAAIYFDDGVDWICCRCQKDNLNRIVHYSRQEGDDWSCLDCLTPAEREEAEQAIAIHTLTHLGELS